MFGATCGSRGLSWASGLATDGAVEIKNSLFKDEDKHGFGRERDLILWLEYR